MAKRNSKIKRDPEKEGKWRKRRKNEKLKGIKGRQPVYVIEYLGKKYAPYQFKEKFCPEWELNIFLYYRKYSPAETVVRYNAKKTPIHIPDVEYTWKDVYMETKVLPTKAVRKAKREREAKKHKKEKRYLIL